MTAGDPFLDSLAKLFSRLCRRDDLRRAYPELPERCRPVSAATGDALEEALTLLYAYLHGSGSSYTPEERAALDDSGGYWCHAGGLSPLRRAAPHIGPETRLADYGAGNGLQGLLFQHLYPHARTTLIELSGPMIERGKLLRETMGIDSSKVEWVHDSVASRSPRHFDFIYIYRPLRPEGEEGARFYRWFADELEGAEHTVTIFSIADCLKDVLGSRFSVFYDDGQLACFTNRPPG